MILALMIIYVFVLYLIFSVFKWVQPSTRNRIYVTVIGLFLIYCILLVINVFQPMSTDLRVFRAVVPISAPVSGPIIDVPIEANRPIKQGDVLFQIDPVPYQNKIDAIEAKLKLARLNLVRAKEMLAKNLGRQLDVDRYTAQVDQYAAELAKAKYDLQQTTVRAPTDGHVSDIALRRGYILGPTSAPVMTFIDKENHALGATFYQEVINRIRPGDEAEIAFDSYPGRTFAARVLLVFRDIPQGQVVPSGQLISTALVPHGRVFVKFELENGEDLTLGAGEAGAAVVYTSQGQAWIPVRKVFFRWYTWLNYIITSMDIRGLRDP